MDVLSRAALALRDSLDAEACAISRVIGDVLLLVTDVSAPQNPIALDRGYLVSEFPATEDVLRNGHPRSLHLDQPGADPEEARLLREMGYSALLMLPLVLGGSTWGLVEVYRAQARPFGDLEARVGLSLLADLR